MKEHVKDIDTANFVYSFFANVRAKLASKFDADWVDNITSNSNVLIIDLCVDENKLLPIIRDIDICKLSSIDNVSTRVIKDAFLVIIPQLVHMYNNWL